MGEQYDTTNSKWLEVVDVPEADDSTFTYDGREQTYQIAESDYYTVSDNAAQTNAGEYTVTVSLNDKDNTIWSDGTTNDKEYSFVIGKATPKVTVTADPASAIAGTTVTVTAEAKDPNNDTLIDIPVISFTYRIGNGLISIFTDSFVIPENTASGTTITITASTPELENYNEGTGTATVVVTDCTHPNIQNTEWLTDEQNHWHECPDCGAEVDKAAHSEDSGTVTTQPTETSEGERTFKCTECSYLMRTEAIAKLDHIHVLSEDYYSDVAGHWHTCSGCSEKVDFESHTEDSGTVTTEPTETAEGVKTFKCTKCGWVIRMEAIAKLDHTHVLSEDYSSDVAGHWHTCSGCSEKVNFESHTEDSGTVTTEPTETTEGVKSYKCVTCGYVMRTETIPALTPEHTHSFGTEWKTDITSHWHECECGEKSDVSKHISDGGKITVQPGVYTTGVRTYSCTVCGYVIGTETIPATGLTNNHWYPIYPTFPTTSTNPGYTVSPSVFTEKLSLTTETDGDTVTLNWNKVDKADKYYVYQYKNGKYVNVKTAANNSVSLNGLKNGESYKFLIRYVVDGKLSPTTYSGKLAFKVCFKPLPKATAEKNSIKLSWKSVTGAEKYAVYKYADGKAVKLAEVKGTSVKINKLLPDTEYSYIVSAYVDGKWTPMYKSDVVTVRTKAE